MRYSSKALSGQTCACYFSGLDFIDPDNSCRDPLNLRTDAELLSALRRAGLLSNKVAATNTTEDEGVTQATRFDLNASVSEEGSNFSAGERQLLALCRALVKESRVIVMVGTLASPEHTSEFSCPLG
jgi:ABC-type multidrug transport system fused ATPase/permease subunit